jgi:thiamine transport system substrate-binding protein
MNSFQRRAFFLTSFALVVALSVAQAQDKPILKVMTYSSFAGEYGPGKAIEEAFEKSCACDLVFTGLEDTGALLARLKLEGENSRTDVVLGLDATQMPDAAPFIAPHGQSVEGLTLPVAWSNPQFIPFDWGHIAMIYDSEKLKTPPTSLDELVNKPDGPRIIVQDPRTSAPGFGFLAWISAVYGDKAGDAWKKLSPRVVTYTKGWSEAYELFLKGEGDMVVSYTTSPAYHIAVEQKHNYKAANFAEGHPLQIEVMGITKGASQPELAGKFLAFMLERPAQELLPEGNFMIPAMLSLDRWPASFKALDLPEKVIALDPEMMKAQRQSMIATWLEASVGK